MALVLLSLAAWPAAASAQGNLVMEPTWHDFGPVSAGTTLSATLDVWNDGSAPLTLEAIGFAEDPGPFAFGDNGCEPGLVLEPDWGCELVVTFTPATRGEYEAVVLVEDQAGVEVASALLTGSSFVPGHLVAEPGALDFGVVPGGMTSSSKAVVVRNAGDTPLTFPSVFGVGIRGVGARDFDLTTNQCVGVLSPGATCGLSVAFHPRTSPVTSAQSAREAHVALYLGSDNPRSRNRALALSVPVTGFVPAIPAPPTVPIIDYGVIEQDLVGLAESVPGLLRGGPRRALRLPAFKAPAAGRLSVLVRVVGSKKRMRLATGAITFESAATGRLRFRVGPKARKLLRQPHKTRVKVTVTFKARATGEAFQQAMELTIRRPAKAPIRKKVR